MMIYLYVRQTVSDYARWKEGFDNHLAARQAGGASHESWVLYDVHDRHEIVVILGRHDLAQARTFLKSVSWKMALQEMGVVGAVEVRFLEGVG